MATKAAETGPGAMGLVAIEQKKFPESKRILSDDLAYPIQQAEKKVPGLWSGVMCRKRYIDDRVSEAVESGQVEAVVNLGAGYDTLSFRQPALAGVRVLELDQRQTIDGKRSRLTALLKNIPAHITLVPIDFDHEDLGTVLTSHGYRDDMKSFFIWEGVTQYLTEAGIRSTFDLLARAAPGSRLVFTYVRKDFVDGEVLYGHDFIYKKMVVKDKIWLFGMDPEEVADFLDVYGWRVMEHLGYEELAERYVKPTGRNLQSMPIERIVCAKKL
jgi:methyltransferase (TIGR00027 family)